MNEQDFEKYLNELRAKQPNDLDVQKWKAAARTAVPVSITFKRPFAQMAAALFVGFFMGCLAMYSLNQKNSENNFAENSSENATIEYVITKMN